VDDENLPHRGTRGRQFAAGRLAQVFRRMGAFDRAVGNQLFRTRSSWRVIPSWCGACHAMENSWSSGTSFRGRSPVFEREFSHRPGPRRRTPTRIPPARTSRKKRAGCRASPFRKASIRGIPGHSGAKFAGPRFAGAGKISQSSHGAAPGLHKRFWLAPPAPKPEADLLGARGGPPVQRGDVGSRCRAEARFRFVQPPPGKECRVGLAEPRALRLHDHARRAWVSPRAQAFFLIRGVGERLGRVGILRALAS